MLRRVLVSGLGVVLVVGLTAMGQEPKHEKSSKGQSKQAPAADAKDKRGGAPDNAAPRARDDRKTDRADGEKERPKIEQATLGGGCFWCIEAVFERVPGVKGVVSGYAGGSVANPTYEMVCTGMTGHAEVVQIAFDPAVVSYEKLLRLFFASHDPTTLNSQGPDFGTQYRSIILYHGEEQKQTARKVYRELSSRRAHRSPIVTELVPYTVFYPAEAYHQGWFREHPYSDYGQTYIVPKVQKLKKLLK